MSAVAALFLLRGGIPSGTPPISDGAMLVIGTAMWVLAGIALAYRQ